MKARGIIRTILFFLVGAILFGTVQYVLTPSWESEGLVNRSFAGYAAMEQDSVDVVFLGNSQMLEGVSPMKLYEEDGIRSYNLATSGQPIESSYFVLKKALKTQSPTAVFYDVGDLFASDAKNVNPSTRLIFDNWALDSLKIEFVLDYRNRWFSDGFAAAVLPIVKYHTRWNQLTENDFLPKVSGLYYTAGEYICSTVSPAALTKEDMNSIAGDMKTAGAADTADTAVSDDLSFETLNENKVEYLRMMKELCEQSGASLVLMKVPMVAFPQSKTAAWTQTKAGQVRALAGEMQLPYLDLLYDEDVVDFTADTIDSGIHLNSRGAEKVSSVLGDYLRGHFPIADRTDAQYDGMLPLYRSVQAVAELHEATDWNSYLALLARHEKEWDVLLCAGEEYTSALSSYDTSWFSAAGLSRLTQGGFGESYLAVIRAGSAEYEALSARSITYTAEIGGQQAVLTSSGWLSGSKASVQIDSREYAAANQGLNFVVVDRATGLVIDGAVCNTRYEKSPVAHISFIPRLLRDYEAAVCFGRPAATG